jgi:protein HOOK3
MKLEEEYTKLASFKPLMETYKDKLGSFESNNSALLAEKTNLDKELKMMQDKLNALEAQKHQDSEQIMHLEERIREMDLIGKFNFFLPELLFSNRIEGGTSGQPLALGEQLSDSSLQTKITQLELENQRLRQQSQPSGSVDSSRILMLENLLEDATKMKEKFEQDYMKERERCLALERQLGSTSDGSSE